MDNIRERAFQLHSDRGFVGEHALDDWLTAERELCWPATEFVEIDKGYEIEVALAGYEPAEIEVTATPRELIVHANHRSRPDEKEARTVQRWSSYRSNDVYRTFGFGHDIDVSRVTAALKNGLLTILAPKLALAAPTKIPVATAA